jgi:hypothetical protein
MAKTLTGTNIKITEQTPEGLVVKCYGGETAPTTASTFIPGAEYTNISTGVTYRNGGTTASPSWQNTDEISSSEIAAGAITLAKLASGVTPSHVVKYSGKITWSGSGASLATTVTGVAATDIVQATIQTVPSEAAYLVSAAPTTNTITLVLSAANTSNDAVIAYTVFRAAA